MISHVLQYVSMSEFAPCNRVESISISQYKWILVQTGYCDWQMPLLSSLPFFTYVFFCLYSESHIISASLCWYCQDSLMFFFSFLNFLHQKHFGTCWFCVLEQRVNKPELTPTLKAEQQTHSCCMVKHPHKTPVYSGETESHYPPQTLSEMLIVFTGGRWRGHQRQVQLLEQHVLSCGVTLGSLWERRWQTMIQIDSSPRLPPLHSPLQSPWVCNLDGMNAAWRTWRRLSQVLRDF